jgi:DNA-binding CsgD family transcriptional regulator
VINELLPENRTAADWEDYLLRIGSVTDGRLILQTPGVPSAPPIELAEGTLLVGRHSTCDLVLKHPSISRFHAEVSVRGDSIHVRDLNSRNGTFLDGQRIEAADVYAGQRLNFGDLMFDVRPAGATKVMTDSALETPNLSHVATVPPDGGTPLPLSGAERRVFELLLLGLSEKEVATRLGVSPHTVHCHVRKIYKLLDVSSRPELLARYVRRGGGAAPGAPGPAPPEEPS